MINLNRLERIIGVRRNGDWNAPRIMDWEDFSYPRLVSVFHTINNVYATYSNSLIEGNRPRVYIVDKYGVDGIGVYKRYPINTNRVLSMARKANPEIDYTLHVDKMNNLPANRVGVYDFSQLDSLYKYQRVKDADYNREYNRLKNIIWYSSDFRLTNKPILIYMDVPVLIPTISEIKRLLRYRGYRVLDNLEDKRFLFWLEVIKYYTGESSIFDNISSDSVLSTYILCRIGNKVSMVRLHTLLGLSNIRPNENSRLKSWKPMIAVRVLLRYIMRLVQSNPSTLSELETSIDIVENYSNDKDDIEKIDIDDEINRHNDIYRPIDIEEDDNEKISEVNDEIGDIESAGRALDVLEDLGVAGSSVRKKITELIQNTPPTELSADTERVDAESNITDFDTGYILNRMETNRYNVFQSIQRAGFGIKSLTTEVKKDLGNEVSIYSLDVLQPNGTSVKIQVRVPIVRPNGKMRINGKDYVLRKQKLDLPIKKINPTAVALTTYYSKMFIYKGQYSRFNLGVAIYKQLSKGLVTQLVYGDSPVKDNNLPRWYGIICRTVRSFLKDDYYFVFDYLNRGSLVDEKDSLEKIEKYGVLIASVGNKYLVLNKDNFVLEIVNNKSTKINHILDYLEIDRGALPVEHCTTKVLGKTIPMILPLMYWHGLKGVIKSLKAKYRLVQSTRDLLPNEYSITFDNTILALDRDDVKSTLVLGGLKYIEKHLKNIPLKMLNTKTGILDILHSLELKNMDREFNSLFSMFVDPMTKEVLKKINMPTTIDGLLIKSAELLMDDNYRDPNYVGGYSIKGYERLDGMIYNILAKAIKKYNQSIGKVMTKLTVPPYELYNYLNSDATMLEVDELNPVATMKQREEITLSGMFGRTKDSVTLKDRSFHESEVGVISEAGKDSGDVGITNYLSAEPKIDNVFGLVKDVSIEELRDSNIYSTSAMLAPFSNTDDGKRLLYIGIQNQHLVPVAGAEVMPVLTGYEAVFPYKVSRQYTLHATKKGKVKKVTKNSITISFTDGTEEKYALKSWWSKDIAGTAYRHKLNTLLLEGDTVDIGDNIYYDEMFFGEYIFNRKRVVYKPAALARVALTEEEVTYEDSSAISKSFTKQLATDITYTREFDIPFDSKIFDIKNIGDKVKYNDPLMVFSNTEADPTVKLSDTGRDILKELSSQAPTAESKGKVVRIEAVYRGNTIDMSEDILNLIKQTDKAMLERYGYKGKVDNTFSVKGNPLEENTVHIKFFIEKTADMDIGSKLIVANQLKATVGEVLDILETTDGTPVDIKFGKKSVDARIVTSVNLLGTTIELQEDSTDRFIKFLDQ